MAKAYRTLRDVSIPVVVGHDAEGENEVTSGENFAAGSLVLHDQLSAFHKKQAENGQLDHLLEPVDDVEEPTPHQRPNVTGEPDFGIFVPEHEAERTALMVYGHGVVPKEQELEALSAGEGHHEEYMAQIKEQGLDRRPVQEHMAQAGQERVPDHLLAGGETAAGMPHNRGPVEQEHGAEEFEDESDAPATRPRPSLAPRAEAGDGHEANSEDAPGETGQES